MSPHRTAVADQVAAATAAARRVVDHLVTEHGQHPGTTVADPWLRRLVDDATRRPCSHLRSPQVAFVIAHERRLACARCQHDAALALRGSPEDGTCDRCRRRQPGDRLVNAMTAAGPLLVPLGLCRNCLPRVHREPTPTRTTTGRKSR